MAQLEKTTMKTFKILAATAAMAMTMAAAGASQATTLVTQLTQDGAHTLGGSAPYGQVSVNDAGGTLAFTVTLFNGLKFGSTSGASDSFAFNLGSLSPSISNIDSNTWAVFGTSGTSSSSSFGNFSLAVDCVALCSDSASQLTFKVSKFGTALTVGDLTTSTKGELFAANVINSRGVGGEIGSAAAAVPEPATWLIMLLGFSGLGAALRHRRQQGVAFAQA
jgi:PEP-CTERM motif